VIIELTRTGGFTGTPRTWRVDAGDDTTWAGLVASCRLDWHSRAKDVFARIAFLGLGARASHSDHGFHLTVDGRHAAFRGIEVTGPLETLVDRIMRDGVVQQGR
jgi:phenylacetate-coenzyme A ligase PaaK-like adenylate-forming protein